MKNLEITSEDVLYTIIHTELTMLWQEVENLNDSAMIDECFSMANLFNQTKVLDIVDNYHMKGRITSKERKVLDDFYVLIHTSIMQGEDGDILQFR
jgi:hypothetical protein